MKLDSLSRQWPAPGLAILIIAIPGCGDELDAHDDCTPVQAADLGESSAALEVCPVWECGSNTAQVNELEVGEMHMRPGENTGEINQWNSQVIAFIAPDGSTDYDLVFEDGVLQATLGDTTLTGAGLVDSRIVVRNTQRCSEHELIIAEHDTVDSWTAKSFPIDRYKITWDDGIAPFSVPVCKAAYELPDDDAWAVIVGGERYSWSEKTVLASGDQASGWFNIACNDNALYKIKLMGYDPEPPPESPYLTTVDQRQAALKMITGDYCGTGTSFTESGTFLHWENADGWSQNARPPDTTIEALWSRDGALCLDTLRRLEISIDDVQAECDTVARTLESCAGFMGAYEWETGIADLPLP